MTTKPKQFSEETPEELIDEDPNESDVSEVYIMPKGYPKKTEDKFANKAKPESDEFNLKTALKEFVIALVFGVVLFGIYELIKNFDGSFVNILIAILSIPGAAIGYLLFTRAARIIGHVSKSDKLKRMD